MTARAISPTSSTRFTPVTSDFQSPRATARTASVICHQRTADALRHQQHDAGKDQNRCTGRGDQPERERAALHFADAHEFIAQGVQFADRRERADAPLVEDRLAARPEAPVVVRKQR